jgi:hypothetical protein
VLVELADGGAAGGGTARRKRRRRGQAAGRDRGSVSAQPLAAETAYCRRHREVRRLFQAAQNPPRWPMYIRQAKQFLRNVDASFDERKFGFSSLVDLLRACQRDGLFRIERDRQGVMRLFPGNVMQVPVEEERDEDTRGNLAEEPAVTETAAPRVDAE